MKLVQPFLAFSLLLPAAGGFLLLHRVPADEPARPQPAAWREDIQRTGYLVSWRIDMEGAVDLQLRMASTDGAEEQQKLWFRTPPRKGTDRPVEEMVMLALLANDDPSQERVLTVSAQHERELSGATPEQALPLNWISAP